MSLFWAEKEVPFRGRGKCYLRKVSNGSLNFPKLHGLRIPFVIRAWTWTCKHETNYCAKRSLRPNTSEQNSQILFSSSSPPFQKIITFHRVGNDAANRLSAPRWIFGWFTKIRLKLQLRVSIARSRNPFFVTFSFFLFKKRFCIF